MKKNLLLSLLVFTGILANSQNLRAPAYPLITHDPYLSIWSFGDTLSETQTKHWTGQDQPLSGIIKIDGQAYQFLGTPPSKIEYILPTAGKTPYEVIYTYKKPEDGWEKPMASTPGWIKGPAPYDTAVSDASLKTRTKFEKEVWYKREFSISNTNLENPQLYISHDSQVEVYLNGVLLFESPRRRQYTKRPLSQEALKTLKPGKNILAIHSFARENGTYIDAGIMDERQLAKPLPVIQKSVKLTATQTHYTFTCGKADVAVTFTTPLLMDQLEVLSRPASYITYDVQSNDGKSHQMQLLLGVSGNISSNFPTQEVEIKSVNSDGLLLQSIGTRSQKILATKGDDVRIDWGYGYLATPNAKNVSAISNKSNGIVSFINNISEGVKKNDNTLTAGESFIGVVVNMGNVRDKKSGHVIVAYDDLYSVQYFGKNLKPWWKRHKEMTANRMIAAAAKDYSRLMVQCKQFDSKLYQQALSSGGKEYADLCQLAYRQAIAAHKIVARDDGTLLFFSKENFSNGSIGTVDVTYPSAPLFLLYNTELLKGMLRPIFEYSENGQFKKPFAAHDVGTYPIANGQTYREDMPVEESGNMLILSAAIAKVEKNAAFAKEHWETLTTWAEYLKKEGFDPANQLCTDDFAGHLARNANLSVKAIMGLASYGMLAGMLGKNDLEKQYLQLAKDLAKKWVLMAKDGDHYSLAFESKGTWSQKYNLVWDKLLKLNIFPKSVAQEEIAYYKTKQQTYALPLDSRKTYTKSDWIFWTATLADNQSDFKSFILPVWKFANETPDRIPLTDWHETTNAKSVGFRARSVVGGYFIKMLDDKLKF